MTNNHEHLELIEAKLDILLAKQNAFLSEINDLRKQVRLLKNDDNKIIEETQFIDTSIFEEEQVVEEAQPIVTTPIVEAPKNTPAAEQIPVPAPPVLKKRIDLEKFIGENLINKIGIVITIIGVAIGAKYTIDNDLISPLTRIILGYLVGLVLLGFGIKSKEKYTNYSSVLVSGAMAIMYFITYAAFSFYGLIPQLLTFVLMAALTVFTVIAAISYDRQVIALIGLVGAYALPFLLSTESGSMVTLFSYMAIINTGILAVAVFRYWKPVYYAAYILTWLMYAGWYAMSYQKATDFGTAFTFLMVFFVIFYATFLAYKLLKNEKFSVGDILLLLSNSFIFFGLGYIILDGHDTWKNYLGLFALLNALIHFVVSVTTYRKQLSDSNLFYIVVGLVLVFITIAIPIQLDGSWVTLLWAGEAALLFWIGRTKSVSIYEILSYVLMLLATMSLLQDWEMTYLTFYKNPIPITSFFNVRFLGSILFIVAFSFILYVNADKKYSPTFYKNTDFAKIVKYTLIPILITVIYMAFRLEISDYFNQLMASTYTNEPGQYPSSNPNILPLKNAWLTIYTFLYLIILTFLNIKIWKNKVFGKANIGLNAFASVYMLAVGLLALSQLRGNYLGQSLSEYYHIGSFNIIIRYIFLAVFAAFMYAFHQLIRQNYIENLYPKFEILLHLCIVWILSSELIHWMDMADSKSYKLGLSILWGIYSLLVISLGIWKNKKYLRVAAMVLFAFTLVKLFVYDIADLNTLPKTVVFVSLGILLLIISFLYNKYSDSLVGE